MYDTIAAISTPKGEGGIGIVRISGKDAFEILEKIFKPHSKKKISEMKTFTINYGILHNNDEVIDEVLVSILRAPSTYTRENMVEINCHGGYIVTEKVLETVLRYGARHSEIGEFTRRAFLNGRIDLTQAEAVLDIIHGKTEKSVSLSLNQLRGDLKEQIATLKKLLLDVAAHINVVLDYPEEGIEDPLPLNLVDNLNFVMKTTDLLISSYDKGKLIKEGLKTAIVGKPNVGKSSLLNSILREDRAIVTHIPGTTRDIIEEVINLNGIPLVLIDTAGIRKTEDLVEHMGIEKSKKMMKECELLLFVIDGSKKIDKEDIAIHENIKDENVIGIINKIDIKEKIDLTPLSKVKNWIEISTKENIGIEEMEEKIYSFIIREDIEETSQKLIITNIRHKTALEKTKDAINNIFETINTGLPMDLIAVDLKEALDSLSEVTGEISSEDLLDHIFKNFCVGK